MPTSVGKGTGRAIAKGHVFTPDSSSNSSRRGGTKRASTRRSGRK